MYTEVKEHTKTCYKYTVLNSEIIHICSYKYYLLPMHTLTQFCLTQYFSWNYSTLGWLRDPTNSIKALKYELLHLLQLILKSKVVLPEPQDP